MIDYIYKHLIKKGIFNKIIYLSTVDLIDDTYYLVVGETEDGEKRFCYFPETMIKDLANGQKEAEEWLTMSLKFHPGNKDDEWEEHLKTLFKRFKEELDSPLKKKQIEAMGEVILNLLKSKKPKRTCKDCKFCIKIDEDTRKRIEEENLSVVKLLEKYPYICLIPDEIIPVYDTEDEWSIQVLWRTILMTERSLEENSSDCRYFKKRGEE